MINYEAPPRLKYVEQAIIGKCLTGKTESIISRVLPSEIYHDTIKQLYEAISAHFYEYSSVSPSVIYDKAENMGLFSIVDLKLWEANSIDENDDALIKELKDYVAKRDIHKWIVSCLSDIHRPNTTSREILADAIRGVHNSAVDLEVRDYNMTEIKHQIEDENLSKQLPLSEPELAEMYAKVGSHTYQTEVHVADSKHGKTTYACYRVADYANQGLKCVYFTLEGSRFDIYEQLVNKVNPECMDNVVIIDKAMKASEIVSKMYELSISHKIDFVVVDYIQRVWQESERYTNEIERIAQASMQITSATLKHGTGTLVLAQPRKIQPERKGWKRFPQVDDVYGTGQIIKDAYCVTAGFRPVLVPGMYYRHGHLDIEGVMNHKNQIVNKNSYFVRMLICRKGEINQRTHQFIHTNKGFEYARETGYHASDFIQYE